jgi:hypothetical protein
MANSQPIFVRQARNESVKTRSAVTSPDGVGSVRLFQADVVQGSRIHAINAVYSGDVSSNTVLRLFLETATIKYVIAEVPIPLQLRTQGVSMRNISVLDYAYAGFLDPTDRYLTLDSGDSLYVGLYDAIGSDIHITAWGGDY